MVHLNRFHILLSIIYKYILSCIFLLTLAGCYRDIYVPVYSCPEPVIPKKILLKTKTNTFNTTDDMLRAMIFDITYLDSYSDQLVTILESYKEKK